MKEVVSSFEDCQGQKEEKTSGAAARPQPINAWPLKSEAPVRRKTSIGRSLATMREPHQKVLATGCCSQEGDRKIELSPPSKSTRGKGEVKD